ncbi:MAG: CotH kinase family protein, partial [Bacteroidota bacterium]
KNYVTTAENVLLGNNFLDPEEGYPKYLDVASFVDFYLINEITRNNDAAFVTSVYLNYVPGGTLKMGPIWDFDISMGNINYNGNEATEGFWMQNTAWYTRLFQDPDFVALVKDRFNYFYSQRDLLYESINTNATILSKPQERNFTQWPILGEYVWPNHVFFSTYEEEVDYLKTWLDERMEWLKVAIDEL